MTGADGAFAPGALAALSLIGTAVFAVSGALQALRKEMDIIGVSFIAALTGVGGGTVRDVLLGATPVGWVRDPTDLVVCISCAFAVSLVNKPLTGARQTGLLYADAAGLALFAVLGAAKAAAAGAHPFVCVLFGAMSATFGGIIRDVVCNEEPVLFRKEIYVTAALVGAGIYIGAPKTLKIASVDFGMVAGLAGAFALRIVAIRKGWSLPFPRYGEK